MRRGLAVIVASLITLMILGGIYAGLHFSNGGASGTSSTGSGTKVQVVAAENFWGSLVSQLGGNRVHVVSVVSDPNADPHEYESNSATAQEIANAALVIVNGAGYDQWALHLIAAEGKPSQTVLNVQEILGQEVGSNPHFWYSPSYVNETIKAMYQKLSSIDPSWTQYYEQQYAALNGTLGAYNTKIQEIAGQFGGTRVAATEDVFTYLANATRLDLVSPPAFMAAVAQGNDPPTASVAQFQQLLQNGSAAVLVYNEQTVTPLTENMKALATQEGIPVVGISETIQPPGDTFQVWMNAELTSLQDALNASSQGR